VAVEKGTTVDRAELHRLVDALPSGALDEARVVLERLVDPVALALLAAPVDDEPVTDADRADLEAGRVEYRRGETLSNDDVRRAMGW
jgi:hypothetical protein